MTTQADRRQARYIPHPRNQLDLELMCLHIYEELYHSSRLFGRSGQWQQGLDILLNDYRAADMNKRGGRVFVQCKFTMADLDAGKIKQDVLKAKEKIETSKHYAGVYLFILATNAENNARLHDKLQEFQLEEKLPFEIEIHNWDKLRDLIRGSNKLWSLFNHQPGEGLDSGTQFSVRLLKDGLLNRINTGALAEARKLEQQRLGGRRGSGYGDDSISLPNDIWKESVELRAALLKLYRQAADSFSALPILRYEYSISRMENVDSLLDYVRADRIVGNLRSSKVPFLAVGDKPIFEPSLNDLAPQIFAMQGSVDKLACLALILIMESGDHAIQDGALEMMSELRKRDAGAAWEPLTHIAYAVIRFYYVMRRGWAPASRYYTVGDSLPDCRYSLDSNSRLLNQPFVGHGSEPVKIAGRDPFADHGCRVGHSRLVEIFSRVLGGHSRAFNLPELEAECRLYSCEDFSSISGKWSESTWQVGRRRVVDFQTLARVAAHNDQKRLLSQYEPLITERTFERLLGSRASLRAHVQRATNSVASAAKLLDSIEELLAVCRYAADHRESGQGTIAVQTVYDQPPPRLVDYVPPDSAFRIQRAFTLTPERMEVRRCRALALRHDAHWCEKLELRYSNRQNDFSLSCLLALHLQVSMLTYSGEDHAAAGLMGIAAQYPFEHS
ncbi:hypothetical protein ACILG0_08925 [Pseudomonadota bacterium AL_CKDN230030165-1A_HGKHYDSX7]